MAVENWEQLKYPAIGEWQVENGFAHVTASARTTAYYKIGKTLQNIMVS